MFRNARRTIYRYVTAAMLVFVIAVPILFSFGVQSAHAQASVIVAESIPEKTTQILEEIGKGLYASALGGLVQGASYFMRKLAYDAATALSSGDKGQQPLAITTNFGKYITETAQDSLAEAISGFGTDFGLDLCQPLDLQLQAKIKIGLDRLYNVTQGDAPKPNCSWQELSKNWREGNATGSGVDSAEQFYSSLQIEQTDFGITLSLIGKLGRLKVEQEKKAEIESIVGRGFKPVTDLISGKVKTPAAVIEEETKALTAKHQGELTAGQITGIYGAGSAQILPMAASVFLNTLTGNLLDKVVKDGLFPSDGGSKTGSQIAGSALDFYGATVINNKKAAEQAFNFFVTAVPVKQQNVFDVIAEFASCGASPGVHNCVIDSGLRDALSRAEKDQPMTVREAIGLGLLHGDWPLIGARHELGATNQDIKRCYLEGYCQSNIQKLRKLRIFPVGFEIAAANSDIDKPWTLNQVINGYYDCSANGKADPAHPFCHLIDPNWILRAPVARCEAEVYGNTLLSSDSPNRRQECADISTCLLEGANNECKGVFGYCTQEKNVWRLPGQTCKAEFATCTTYKNTRTNQLVSYLARTVDAGSCDANAAGCRAYSIAKKPNGSWVTSEEGKTILGTQTVFFNQSIQSFSCTETAEGCSAFLPAIKTDAGYAKPALNTTPVRLKKAPQYLGCYDIDPVTSQIEYPTTNAQLALLPKTDACKPFAQSCIAEEIGCEMYTSSDGGPNVPGIVGDFACPASCIGYDTFKQKETAFASAVFPLHFVPSVGLANMNKKGQMCSAQYEGCDQFTNLDAAAAGGEGLEYYTNIKYCERPAADKSNTKTYYSWEGSANSGYALQVHTLRLIAQSEAEFLASLPISAEAKQEFSAGAPAYAADDPVKLDGYVADCNQTAYNIYLDTGLPGLDGAADSGCRALYDTAGNIFYRLLEHTVSVSTACHPLRKTESNFFVDANIDEPNFCAQKFGNWTDVAGDGNNTPVCQRCVGGGQYQNGACVYWAIDAPNESNSCIPAANGCRAYVGNGGNNVEQIALDGFEPGDGSIDAWGPKNDVSVAAEAVQVNLHSLKINADSVFRLISETDLFPAPAGTYELRFWARGAPQNLSIRFEQNNQPVGVFASAETPAAIGSAWKQYTVGPVTFTGDSAQDATLVFTRTLVQDVIDKAYFLDNVELRRFDDVVYLVKNSWKTPQGYDAPAECFAADQKPSDPFPGVALGCRAYTDSKGAAVAATGFEQLCRPEAVGCQALYDTQNTAEEEQVLYHARCIAAAGQVCELTAVDVSGTPIQALGSCTVAAGETGCYVDKIILPANIEVGILNFDYFDLSTVSLPSDTPEATPLFLTNAPKYQCDSKNLGCTRFGLESQILPDKTNPASFEFSDVFLINDPKKYTGNDGTLCLGENIGCTAFAANNTVQYFKDPQIYGQGLCSYKENISIGGVNRSGWFLDDVGTCSNDATKFCTANDSCASGATCQDIGTTACYPNYILPNGSYGAWSNESDNYLGRVAQCDAANNRCTELLDPADTSGGVYPKGKPYHVIFDEKITADVADCGEGASLKEGCVLFDKTDNPNKLFSSEKLETLSESANPKYGFVPINKLSADNAVDNDANILLKVSRDRQCSEWLSCLEKRTEKDPSGNKVALCTAVGLCNEADPAGRCTSWVERTVDDQHVTLSEQSYVSRDTSWYAPEYSGYSIANQYPVDTFLPMTFAGISKALSASYLAHKILDAYLGNPLDLDFYTGCVEQYEGISTDGKLCGPDSGGRCFGGSCVYPTDGVFNPDEVSSTDTGEAGKIISIAFEITQTEQGLEAPSCKSFPEANSPFPKDIELQKKEYKDVGLGVAGITRIEFTQKKSGFEAANVCQNGACECKYTKAVYKGAVTDYWDIDGDLPDKGGIRDGVCIGGSFEGSTCNPPASSDPNAVNPCGQGGTCARLSEKSTRQGFFGFCLEDDISRPGNCLTWYPIDVDASGIDTYNNSTGAGYSLSFDAVNGGVAYCLDSNAKAERAYNVNQWNANLIKATKQVSIEQTNKGKKASKAWIIDGLACNEASNDNKLVCDTYTPDDKSVWAYHELFLRGGHILEGAIPQNPISENVKNIYTAAQEWAWFGLQKKNIVVQHIVNPWRWAIYSINTGLNQSLVDIDDNGFVDSTDLKFVSQEKKISGDLPGGHIPSKVNSNELAYTNPKILRVEDVSRLYLAPLILPDSPASFYPGAYINFDELRIKAKGSKLVADFRPLGINYASMRLEFKKDDIVYRTVNYIHDNVQLFEHYITTYNLVPGNDPKLLVSNDPNSDGIDSTVRLIQDDETYTGNNKSHINYYVFVYRSEENIGSDCTKVDYSLVIPLKNFDDKNEVSAADFSAVLSGSKSLVNPYVIESESEISYIKYDISVNEEKPECDSSPQSGLDFLDIENRSTWTFVQGTKADVLWKGKNFCDPAFSFGDGSKNATCFIPATLNTDSSCSFSGSGDKFGMTYPYNKYAQHLFYGSGSNAKYYDGSAKDGIIISCWAKNSTKIEFTELKPTKAYGPALGYLVELKSQCTDSALVYKEGNLGTQEPTDKAWTNRLWQQTNEETKNTFLDAIGRIAKMVPYGSINQNETDFVNVKKQIRFEQYDADGIPYRCNTDMIASGLDFMLIDDGLAGCSMLADALYPEDIVTAIGNHTEPALTSLHFLFAKSFARKFIKDDGSFLLSESIIDTLDVASEVDITGLPPQIYSLNPATCSDGNDETVCTAAEKNNITINGKNGKLNDYDKDQFKLPDEDQNFDGQPDEVIGDAGQLLADMNFFAFADDNRMPIRRVLIDWGDDAPILNDGKYGRYQNRKPFCGGETGIQKRCANILLQALTCTKDADCLAGHTGVETTCNPAGEPAFGDADRACRADSFSFQHTYLCRDATPEVNKRGEQIKFAVGELPTATQNRLKNTHNLSDTDIVCQFTPRVQALDNWGWCNGECNGAGNSGCYNSVQSAFGGITDQCDPTKLDPWTKYQGTIIVVPKK